MDKRIRLALVALSLLGLLAAAGCAPGPNPQAYQQGPNGAIASFPLGLWHGVISPFTFVLSLFREGVSFYETYNDGLPYNFGFLLGMGVIVGLRSPQRRRAPQQRAPAPARDEEDDIDTPPPPPARR